MKIKNNTLYIILYFLMFFLHFGIWRLLNVGFETTFIKYYIFLTILFMIVITVLSIIKKIYPNYIGFAFLGLVIFKLAIMFLIIKKLNLQDIPHYKIHFIVPYLISLLFETLYSVKLIQEEEILPAENSELKDEKNQ